MLVFNAAEDNVFLGLARVHERARNTNVRAMMGASS